MNTNTNEMNMKELNLDEMEQVSGADLRVVFRPNSLLFCRLM